MMTKIESGSPFNGILGENTAVYMYSITPGQVWILVNSIAVSWDTFNQLPKQIEAEGLIFEKKSKIHDGVLYATSHTDLDPKVTFQNQIAEWTRSIFTEATPQSIAVRALEECIELCFTAGLSRNTITNQFGIIIQKCFRNHMEAWQRDHEAEDHSSWESHPRWDHMADEAADITFCLIDLLALGGRDIQHETYKKLRVNKERVWAPTGEDGQRRSVK